MQSVQLRHVFCGKALIDLNDRFHAFATVATPYTPKQNAERTARHARLRNGAYQTTSLGGFRVAVCRLWRQTLKRRSQRIGFYGHARDALLTSTYLILEMHTVNMTVA